MTRRIMREYTMDDCTTPCQRACPAGINIREYIHQIAIGDCSKAVAVIKERNPFPTVIGRICPRPCELECRRKHVDEPVAINFLKRYAADYEKGLEERVLPFKAPETHKKVAVVGGGVQGLSTAFFTARLGHEVLLMEATDKLGGMLRTAIARERLPGEILDWDIQGVLEMGVDCRLNTILGRDVSIASLLEQGHEAVFLASGGWDGRLSAQQSVKADPAELIAPIPGVYLMIDLFMGGEDRLKKAAENNRLVVAGTGASLAAAAEKLADHKAAVTLVLTGTAAEENITDQRAAELQAKGVSLVFQAGVTGLLGNRDKLASVSVVSGPDKAGSVIEADGVVFSRRPVSGAHFQSCPRTGRGREETGEEPAGFTGDWKAAMPYKHPGFFRTPPFSIRASPSRIFPRPSRPLPPAGGGRHRCTRCSTACRWGWSPTW